MTKRLKIVISVSLVGFALVMFSVIQSPSAKVIFASLVSLAQYLVANSGKIITSPACYGSIGLLILFLALRYLTHYQKAERREAREQARQQRREDFERRMQEFRESKIYSVPKRAIENLIKRPPHRQKINDDDAVSMILQGKSYGQTYDIIFPPLQGKEDIERLKGFEKWRTRVSKKVNKDFKKYNVKK